ncbi:hypothetical protein EGW08_001758 [Elysia chlorotica]|uniref:Protein inhibitor of activated STAT n=1 Tax=Elysia chlorotica TaxID=188477 RepID=A0A3S1BWK3_ELYCH|nr:hypothetical protein EGW08_001758 [Elysia chlorotica]
MADLAELKQMVLCFRVSELHVLLGFAGRNKSGRKQELTQRALALVQKGCALPVQIKIRELYRQIYPMTKSQNITTHHKDPNAMPMMHRHPVGLDYSVMNNLRSMLPQQQSMPVNPDVKLRHLPFYDVLGELMKPSTLIPKNNGRMQETLFVFHLTPQQAQDITMSRDFRPGARCEYTVQVQLRFCLLETTCEQADTFPSQIQVRVNNKPAALPNVIPTNKPNVEPKRPGRPVDITSLCRLSPTVSNAITVTWASDPARSFCMSIYLVRKLTSDILLTRLKQFGNRHLDHTKALIKEKLAQDPDSEIATTSLRVSLMCPLGKMRMQIPCRASTCTHLQCFDAATFLMMNERKPTWMCPVCDRPCPYEKLIIDGYFVEIFRNAPSCNDIIFHEDGNWSPMKPQKESSNQVVLTPSTPKAPAPSAASHSSSTPSSVISLSSVTTNPTTTNQPPGGSAPKTSAPAAAKAPVIDLTLDSSDEDDDSLIQQAPPRPATSSPSSVINLDASSPAPTSTMPPSPATVLSSKSPSPAVPPASAPASHPTRASSYQSNGGYTSGPGSHSSTLSGGGRDSPALSAVDSILQSSSSALGQPSPSSSSIQSQPLNLEAMSDADFDDFLKGLSWGV